MRVHATTHKISRLVIKTPKFKKVYFFFCTRENYRDFQSEEQFSLRQWKEVVDRNYCNRNKLSIASVDVQHLEWFIINHKFYG